MWLVFNTNVKHSLSFDRLAENQVYEIVKAFDQEFFKLEDIHSRGDENFVRLE